MLQSELPILKRILIQIDGTITTTGTTVNKTKILQIHDKREEIEKYNGREMRLYN